MVYRHISAFILLCCFLRVSAQDPSKTWIGISGSADIVNTKYAYNGSAPGTWNPYGTNYHSEKRAGGTVGIFLSRTLKRRLSFQIGLQYLNNGDRYYSEPYSGSSINGVTLIGDGKEKHFHWINIPLKLNYAFVAKKKLHFYVYGFAGPAFDVRESQVTLLFFDDGGEDRNNLHNKNTKMKVRPVFGGGVGVRLRLSYRWVATLEPKYGVIFNPPNALDQSSVMNSYGIVLGFWKAI